MTKSEILEFLNKNPMINLATSEGGKPHVRGMLLYRADDKGILFHTGRGKDLHKQLESNPWVEICSFSKAENKQVRVSGKAEPVEDESLKKEIVENRPFMKPWVEKDGLGLLAVWCVTHGKACVWTMESNFAPKAFVDL